MNCENYGTSTFIFKHSSCGQKYAVTYKRVVKAEEPYKATKDHYCSFGE